MDTLLSIFTYTFLFLILYFQVFLILTMIEHKSATNEKMDQDDLAVAAASPTVTIIVPVFNEQETVAKTIRSLLAMRYPKEKLNIMVVDDGSKDNTWEFIQQFKDNPQITLYKKENGGKYTALNYGIEHSTSEYIGCLDADSFVDSEALNYIIPYFEDQTVMAVTPSLKIQNPDNILRMIQNAEYNMGIFTRKILGLLDAQYVTPGPFSIFRKEVFKTVGVYRHAHNTEDLEMAFRLQQNHFRIVNANKAVVYTVGPRTLYRLYKQRVRWTGGFIQNTLDYKRMLLNPKYGNLGLLVLPMAMYSIVASMLFLFVSVYFTSISIITSIQQVHMVGFSYPTSDFFRTFTLEWWLYHTQTTFLIGTLMTLLIVFAIWYGKRLAGVEDRKNALHIAYFLLFYSLISPFWLVASVYNTIRNRDAAWR